MFIVFYWFIIKTVQDFCKLSPTQLTAPDATKLDSFVASGVYGAIWHVLIDLS